MAEPKALRRDARDNAAKLRAAALDVFLTKGLDAPIQEIAKAAGVSVGTLYNRFGTREGLIDAVIPDVAGARLQALGAAVMAKPTVKERLRTFVHGMIDLQHQDPALNDAVLRRYPDAVALLGVCDVSARLGQDLVREAHREGALSADFTEDDLFGLLWLSGTASRDPAAPPGWRRLLERALDSALT
ncbi:AcrR family transcriptional regulator [Kibdelosporangium banguiense]|uniref:AcrR family transcriptional regulator n=1 Tax=Kibdelosporangium banguiense TaxID=1365924 RepID=A0ABS4TPY5_9PSEU|nr:TetR/AcrR family transcriptional regulator [Kibdelosporangium banguiense]MBP2326463.1 AcrR family transcriptional regulator [Kibdelosporangium banguiense]